MARKLVAQTNDGPVVERVVNQMKALDINRKGLLVTTNLRFSYVVDDPMHPEFHSINTIGNPRCLLLVPRKEIYFEILNANICQRLGFSVILVKPMYEGQLDFCTFLFLKEFCKAYQLPLFVLLDFDALSMQKILPFAQSLGMKWLGLKYCDAQLYANESMGRYKTPLTQIDRDTIEWLLDEDYIQKDPELREGIADMLKSTHKVSMEAILSCGLDHFFDYLSTRINSCLQQN